MVIHQGEVRQIGIEVINQLGQDFVIEAAEYEVIKKDGTEVEKGSLMIKEHKLITLFSAVETGWFYVIFKYHIGAEILKAKILVEVVK